MKYSKKENNSSLYFLRKATQWKHYWPQTLIACSGVILSIALYFMAYNWEREEAQLDFRAIAQHRVLFIRKDLEAKTIMLKSIASFFQTSSTVNRDAFAEFVTPFFSSISGIQALEWIPRVKDAERAEYEMLAKRDGLENFQITERRTQGSMTRAALRGEYFPVYYVEPLKGNEAAVGFDLASNPTRLSALDISCDDNKVIATARITLVQEAKNQFGFLVFLPIYRKHAPIDTLKERRENLKGFVLGVFRVENVVESALSYLPPQGIDLYVFDTSAPQGKRFLYFHSARTSRTPGTPVKEYEKHLPKGFYYISTIEIGGRSWTVLCIPSSHFFLTRRSATPWILLVSGLLITALLCVYFRTIIERTKQVEKLVDERTEELMESEQRWQFALEGSGDGVWDWNVQTNEVLFSKRWKEMLGFKESEIRNDLSEWEKRVHPDDIAGVNEEIQKHFKRETPVYIAEHRVLCKHGTYKWILDRGKVISWTKDGKPSRMIGTHGDITARKEMEQLKDEFINTVSHEMRTPLAIMKESIYLARKNKEKGLPAEEEHYLEMSERNAARLARLVTDILDYQKLCAGKMHFNVAKGNVNELIEGVKREMLPIVEKKGLELKVQLAENLPSVEVDGDRITQVLVNLINNAIKFTEEGSVAVITERMDNEIRVAVRDTGIGIKKEDVGSLFESFVQIYVRKERKTGGTGLGLAISKSIIEQHEGKIWIESEYGKGSTFYFTLPVKE